MARKAGDAEQSIQQQMTERFGFVPPFYDVVAKAALPSVWATQRELELGETALPNKTKELIGLAIAAHIKCRYCIYFHSSAARAFGASDEELREACLMGGFTVQMSNALTGMQFDLDEFRREVDSAITFMTSGKGGQPTPQHPGH
jgi:AhpD family alkylhydroperoxidase